MYRVRWKKKKNKNVFFFFYLNIHYLASYFFLAAPHLVLVLDTFDVPASRTQIRRIGGTVADGIEHIASAQIARCVPIVTSFHDLVIRHHVEGIPPRFPRDPSIHFGLGMKWKGVV